LSFALVAAAALTGVEVPDAGALAAGVNDMSWVGEHETSKRKK
jgi:hypothetical protein